MSKYNRRKLSGNDRKRLLAYFKEYGFTGIGADMNKRVRVGDYGLSQETADLVRLNQAKQVLNRALTREDVYNVLNSKRELPTR